MPAPSSKVKNVFVRTKPFKTKECNFGEACSLEDENPEFENRESVHFREYEKQGWLYIVQ